LVGITELSMEVDLTSSFIYLILFLDGIYRCYVFKVFKISTNILPVDYLAIYDITAKPIVNLLLTGDTRMRLNSPSIQTLTTYFSISTTFWKTGSGKTVYL
jgi:hypothetical protein